MSQHLILGNASLPSFLFLYFLELLWLIVLLDVITSLTLCLKEKNLFIIGSINYIENRLSRTQWMYFKLKVAKTHGIYKL